MQSLTDPQLSGQAEGASVREPGSGENLDVLDHWLSKATSSLLSNWAHGTSEFWRDSWRTATGPDEDERESKLPGFNKGATSNNRSFQSLVVASLVYATHPDPDKHRKQLSKCARAMVTNYYTRALDELRNHSSNDINPYTDAQLLLSLSLAMSPVVQEACAFSLDPTQHATLLSHVKAMSLIVSHQLTDEGVRVHELSRPHHFLTLHTVRALDAAERTLSGLGERVPRRVAVDRRADRAAILDDVRREIVRQLGLHMLPAPGFDSSSLVSCCALLSRLTGEADSPLILRAVDALVEDQSTRGTWNSAGSITFQRRRVVYMPSIELSLALSNLALLDLREGDHDVLDRADSALRMSLRLVQGTYTEHNGSTGWANDRTRSGHEVESWTTAVVLQFLASFRNVLTAAKQTDLLRSYEADMPHVPSSGFWSDLDALIPSREQQRILRRKAVPATRIRTFTNLTDPTTDNRIVKGVRDEILVPTLANPYELPTTAASFLLYGPPGTRKTSFVAALARELRWPLITLSPPMFLQAGIEGFEATAEGVFADLMQLERAVVLFDECEEFFRYRESEPGLGSRTAGAFITSGMLPRLQRLRDQRAVIFVINTNVEKHELDDAVTRRGRLDFTARVGQPSLKAQLRYLKLWRSRDTKAALTPEMRTWFAAPLARIDAEMRKPRRRLLQAREEAAVKFPQRGDKYRNEMRRIAQLEAQTLTKVVTFGMLDELALRCLDEGSGSVIEDAANLEKNLSDELARYGPDSLSKE